ncbi:MAG: glucosaminidase domain-containing protein [Paludibacter sp.]|nr:glucosaminidase domain-containing protein [Paludibacter sp.]
MKFKKRTRFTIILLFISLLAFSQSRKQSYLDYIDQYHQLAEKQQREHGIPASIVLAQGLLESGAGMSQFAKESNNHFGIKCNDWTGDKIYHDDDQKGECFRKYSQVIDSYEDHAVFLKTRPRYSFLFDLNPTDYEAWAHGLKKAGYATDPTYAFKLISLIEVYDLHRFDLGESAATNNSTVDNNTISASDKRASIGKVKTFVNHLVVKVNGVKFVTSLPGDSYAGIADEFRITEDRIRNYNEVNSTVELKNGSRVFLAAKKKKAPKNCETHAVQVGESLHSISQDYGIRIKSIYKMNKIPFSEGVQLGQVLKLR